MPQRISACRERRHKRNGGDGASQKGSVQILIVTATALLCFSLLLAWLLSMVKGMPDAAFHRFIKSEKALLQAHIDYVLMAILLFVFALSGHEFPAAITYATIVGSITNPLLFLVMAVKPDVAKTPFSPFGIASVLSFITTTTGMAGCALVWSSSAS